ncbi:MAG TPA: DUF4388 domain-containing protein [Planctomycetota bacterium]|nr:DUF4388 domain-containing protein [Planctomycetota bacterium]
MPIQGPLRELGIHDVFQLLDLSRKTGRLQVTSELRSDESAVWFSQGRVVYANMKSKPATVEDLLVQSGRVLADDLSRARELRDQLGNGASATDILVQAGALSAKEIERLRRERLETVVFDLMSWREGYFTFEERDIGDVPAADRTDVATESLLMESARRIDEWSRIADKVPNLTVIPALAPVSAEHETQLDLLPHEWEVLTMIDGERDLKSIASALGHAEFEIAKIAYGLVTTGVIEISQPRRLGAPVTAAGAPDAREQLDRGFAAARAGNLAAAIEHWENVVRLTPADASASRARAALEAAVKLQAAIEAHGHG